jgi:hypothetical protein
MIERGAFVIIHLQSPKEKFWGLLADINAAGATILGIDLNSFEDWTRMIIGNGRNIGLTAMFHPMWRVERISLDQTVDDLLSLQAQFEMRVGMPVRQYLEGQFPELTEPDTGEM